MSILAHRDHPNARARSKPPAGRAKPLTDAQRAVLQAVWTYLVAMAGDGHGVHSGFKIHSFALQLCFPRAGKWTTTKPAAYQNYAHDAALRPWSTDGEKQLVFVILSSMQWSETANAWTLKRPIAEFASQIGCGRTRINDALNAHRDSGFPVLQVDNSPAFERGGHRYRGALTFTLVRDPFKFAEARDKARASRLSAEDERRRALHGEVVKLQIARDRGEITPREFARRKAIITHQIRWASGDVGVPLVAVEPPEAPQSEAATPDSTAAADVPVVALKGKERRQALTAIEAVYPKASGIEADLRMRARERWELLQPTQVLVDTIIANVRQRIATPKGAGGWADVDPQYVPDLHTYLRDQLWKVAQ